MVTLFSFTKGVRPLRIEARPWTNAHPFGTLLFDLEIDPAQKDPIYDPEIEKVTEVKAKVITNNTDDQDDQIAELVASWQEKIELQVLIKSRHRMAARVKNCFREYIPTSCASNVLQG